MQTESEYTDVIKEQSIAYKKYDDYEERKRVKEGLKKLLYLLPLADELNFFYFIGFSFILYFFGAELMI